MLKTVSHQVFSMLLALLVLLSTFSFKMESHFCGSKLVDIAVFSKVKTCCNSEITTASKLQLTKTSCCNTKVLSIDGLKQFKIVPFLKEFSTNTGFATLSIFNFDPLFFGFSEVVAIHNYNPPDLVLNLQVQHQVFLI